MKVVLASASPRRRELLAALVADFEVVASDVPEEFTGEAIDDAMRLAAEKAGAVAESHPGAVVLAADTIVFDEAHLYGKPFDADEAGEMLRTLQGRDHEVVTGIAVAHGGDVERDASVARVTVAPLSESQLEDYVASGVPLDKAGAYAIQHEEWPVVEGLAGCYCNVVGLPLWRARALLLGAGIQCRRPDATYERCATCPDSPGEERRADPAPAP